VLADAEQQFNAPSAKREFAVQTNVPFTAESSAKSWCTVSVPSAQDKVIVTVTENTSTERTADVSVKASGFADVTIKIVQDKYGWKLVWADEFNIPNFLDPAVWSRCSQNNDGFNNWTSNNDLLYDVKDGNLILRAIKNPGTIPNETRPYLQSVIESKGKKTIFTSTSAGISGKLEVRAKFTSGKGSWPAIWMLHEPGYDSRGNSFRGEIDLMEHDNNNNYITHDIHTPHLNLDGYSKVTKSVTLGLLGSTKSEYHTYSVEIHSDKLVFGVDGTTTLTYSRNSSYLIERQFPFCLKGYFVILNMALHQNTSGSDQVDPAQLPVEMQVDYVRYYEWK
jgi:beta-glucanase (GH16 family)